MNDVDRFAYNCHLLNHTDHELKVMGYERFFIIKDCICILKNSNEYRFKDVNWDNVAKLPCPRKDRIYKLNAKMIFKKTPEWKIMNRS